jgi:MFS family permease
MQPTSGTGPLHHQHVGWSGRLIGQVAVLILVNAMVDTVVTAPIIVLQQMLDHFHTDQAAWLNSSALLAGAMWAPLLGKCADIYGKRRVLVGALITAGVGALICLAAPDIWVFVVGRVIQGAAVGAVFLSVALVNEMCAPRVAMPVVGMVTTGNAIVSVGGAFLLEALGNAYGYRVVFIISAGFAAAAVILVLRLIPRSTLRTPGKVDVVGALMLGGGLALVLSYISLGSDYGWFGFGPVALLVVGVLALARWFRVSGRIPEPVVDLRDLGRSLVLTLTVVVLGTGAYQSMLQLMGLIADVSPGQGLGYGIAGTAAKGLLFGIPAIGIVAGGTAAGHLATRVGPAPTLLGGLALGSVATIGMFVGAAHLPVAVCCSFLLSLTAGTLVTSGFNMATALAPPERQGVVSSMVMVMVAIGATFLNFIGAAVLKSTSVVDGGKTVDSALGVYSYIAIAAGAFVVAAVPAVRLVLRLRVVRAGRPPAASEPAVSAN